MSVQALPEMPEWVRQRADRALLRVIVPYEVDGIVIEHVVRWILGDEHNYAEAVVITRRTTREGLPTYSVHNLVWRQGDERQEFMLYRGAYDIETFDQAMTVAAAR